MSENLLPCPWCGKTPEIWRDESSDYREDWTMTVSCRNPECIVRPAAYSTVSGRFTDLHEAAEIWNRRSYPAVAARKRPTRHEDNFETVKTYASVFPMDRGPKPDPAISARISRIATHAPEVAARIERSATDDPAVAARIKRISGPAIPPPRLAAVGGD